MAAPPSRPVVTVATGLVPYPVALSEMESRVEAIRAGAAAELVWLVEHPPLYTAGTSAQAAELVAPNRFPTFNTGRGGRWTYHGPGQRIAYVMLDLRLRGGDLRRHVWRLEELVIRCLADLGVMGERRDDRIGVWVSSATNELKIAAVGVRVRKWVTYHGVALNVAPDLAHFDGIVPCGIRGHGVTSLAALGCSASMGEVDSLLLSHLDAVLAA